LEEKNTQNIYKSKPSIPPARFEPANPAIERLHACTLDCASTGIGCVQFAAHKFRDSRRRCIFYVLFCIFDVVLLYLLPNYSYLAPVPMQRLFVATFSIEVTQKYTRWFKYDRDYLCVNKSQFVPVIFEPPYICTKLARCYSIY
jgi:hypothetical protein